MEAECEGFTFTSKFDSGNLDRVEFVPKVPKPAETQPPKQGNGQQNEGPDFEFNLWTKPDCGHTEFENGNRTWFYFGVRGGPPFSTVKFNIMNMNRQHKMFSEGMTPVCKVVPGRPHWERIHDKPTFTVEQKKFVLSFKYRTLENQNATTYFAFTYPFSYTEAQNYLRQLDTKCQPLRQHYEQTKDPNTIYYHRECMIRSTEHRRVDLVTVSSYHGISDELEPRLRYLFPETNVPRPHRFPGKKVVMVSARVHPGETQSSFVLNGMLSYLVSSADPMAQQLRKQFVFKFVPILNPDGVANGHYRTDMRGVNLNRVYLNPSLLLHPSIFATRSIIRYHHYGCEMPEEESNIPWDSSLYATSESSSPDLVPCCSNSAVCPEESDGSCSDSSPNPKQQVLVASQDDDAAKFDEDTRSSESFFSAKRLSEMRLADENSCSVVSVDEMTRCSVDGNRVTLQRAKLTESTTIETAVLTEPSKKSSELPDEPTESGIFIYLDLHGHASKKGVFMYGNHFENIEDSIETFLMPKIMSLNNPHFHFTSCNFSKRNMYLRDRRDGMSREGSGRVAVFKMTGLVRCYTLECNYNTGRLVNTLPSNGKDHGKQPAAPVVPPKYNPQLFEEVGKAMAISILDLTGSNPSSRIRHSEFRGLPGLKDWLRRYIQTDLSVPRLQRKTTMQVQVTTTTGAVCVATPGASGSTGSALPPVVDGRRRVRAHLTPLLSKDVKENVASGSQVAEPAAKLKHPMSPKENILQAPTFPRTPKKLGRPPPGPETPAGASGRTARTRRAQPQQLFARAESSTKSVQVLKQGPKRLRISSVKQESQLETSFQVLAAKPDALWDGPTTSRPPAEQGVKKLAAVQQPAKVRAGRPIQPRGPHLSPVRKGGALTRKKGFEWEKKKGKVLAKKKLTVSSEESLENAPLPLPLPDTF